MKKYKITVMRPQGVHFEELTKEDVLRFTYEDLQTVLIHIIDANSAIRKNILSTQTEYAKVQAQYDALKSEYDALGVLIIGNKMDEVEKQNKVKSKVPEPQPSAPVTPKKKPRSKSKPKSHTDELEQLRKDMQELAEKQKLEQEKTAEEPDAVTPATKVAETTGGSGHSKNGAHHTGGAVGVKLGKSSPFHYTYLERKKNRYRADVRIGDKRLQQYSNSEIQCALSVDEFLDNLEDTKRKRNRDEFPEILEAYQLNQKKLQAQEKKNVSSW